MALAARVGPVARQAPHRSLAQRPGRHRPAALAAPDASTSSTRLVVELERALVGLALRHASTRSCPATRTSSRRSRCSSRTTSSPTSRCSSATVAGSRMRVGARTCRRSAPARSRGPASRSTARPWRRSSGFDGVTRNSIDAVGRPRLRGRGAGRGRARDDAPVAPGRGARVVVEPARSASCASPTPSRPARR